MMDRCQNQNFRVTVKIKKYNLLSSGEPATDPRDATLATHLVEILLRGVDGEQNVGLGNGVATTHNLRTCILVRRVEKSAGVTSARFDVNRISGFDKAGHITGSNGNTLFSRFGVFQNAEGEGGAGPALYGVGPV